MRRHLSGRVRGHVPAGHPPEIGHILAALAAAVLFSAGSFAAGAARGHVPGRFTAQVPAEVVRDDFGRPFTLPAATPGRIVSMAPNVTEILFALGLGPNVVGVTRFCDHPPEALSLPKIGGLVDPNVEIIQSLRPDLVVAFRGNPLRLLDRLSDLKLPVFALDAGGGLDALAELILRIGLVTRREAEARALSNGLRARERAVAAALGEVTERPRVFVFLYGQGLWTCGGQSYLNDVIWRAGAVNIAAALPKKWALYSRERIIGDDPDAVFILAKSEADFAAARAWLAGEGRLGSLAAVAAGRVHFLDENASSRFGPRLVDVLERMARALHPGRFGGRP